MRIIMRWDRQKIRKNGSCAVSRNIKLSIKKFAKEKDCRERIYDIIYKDIRGRKDSAKL